MFGLFFWLKCIDFLLLVIVCMIFFVDFVGLLSIYSILVLFFVDFDIFDVGFCRL